MQQPLNAGRQYIMPSSNKIQTFYSSGINYVWYLTIELIGKSHCRIIRHWRIHRSESNRPKADTCFHIVEDAIRLPDGWPTRNAIAVDLFAFGTASKKRLHVDNPGYVFAYDGETDQPAMHV